MLGLYYICEANRMACDKYLKTCRYIDNLMPVFNEDVVVVDQPGREVFSLRKISAQLSVGAVAAVKLTGQTTESGNGPMLRGKPGDIVVNNADGKSVFRFTGGDAHLIIGCVEKQPSNSGELSIRHRFGVDVLRFNAETGRMEFINNLGRTVLLDGARGDLQLGGFSTDGHVTLLNKGNDRRAEMGVDNNTQTGYIRLNNNNGETALLDGNLGDLHLGRFNTNGAIHLYNINGSDRAQMFVGNEPNADGGIINLFNNKGERTVNLNGGAGDIVLSGADVAEEFNVFDSDNIDEGTVLVFDEDDDRLAISTKEYDNKVAGIVSGSTERKPALILDKMINSKNRRIPLALVGKVLCKVDATFDSISRGDMLTTSSTPGHAMKAIDPLKSFGATVGKALKPLKSGKGVIDVLAILQ
jgi:hypothetical protein